VRGIWPLTTDQFNQRNAKGNMGENTDKGIFPRAASLWNFLSEILLFIMYFPLEISPIKYQFDLLTWTEIDYLLQFSKLVNK